MRQAAPIFSVVIPLYNKSREISRAVSSVLGQSMQPIELIIVDDGSTDGGAEVASGTAGSFVGSSCRLSVVRQENAGAATARNKGISMASGTHIAFLDADDWWERDYLARMADLIARCPDCGAYSAGFTIRSRFSSRKAPMPSEEGVIHGFFYQSMSQYICQPSATVIPRSVISELGGFPDGMRLGEDLYMWIKIARRHSIAFLPEFLVNYSRCASNRSFRTFRKEETEFSFEDFYRPGGFYWMNEYIARCAIGKAITQSVRGDRKSALKAERSFRYTKRFRRQWLRLFILNRMPRFLRVPANGIYSGLAWAISHRGL